MSEQLLSLNYWFNTSPGELDFSAAKYFLIVLVAMMVLRFVLSFKSSKSSSPIKKKIYKRFSSIFGQMTFWGLLWLLLAYQDIPFFSARFWILVWALAVLVWFVIVAIISKKDLMFDDTDLKSKEKSSKDQYLPKPKK